MFVIQSLAVLCMAYWSCAIAAQLLLTSAPERALPAAARAGVGLLWLLTVFAAGWQIFSPAITWGVGFALLAAWLGRGLAVLATPRWWRELAAQHWRTFAACLAIALVFFAPLAVKQRFGPFTEGGGDVNIYADTALYLGKLGYSARGAEASTPADFARNLGDVIDTTLDSRVANQRAMERYEKADRAMINPPAAENAIYRGVVVRSFSPLLYAPYVAFGFLDGPTNYHVYYGLQALVYALLVACGWATFRRHGRAACMVYAGLLVASHSLVSIPYNTYSAQTLALFSCALLLCLLFHGVRPWSRAGVRSIVIPFIFIGLSYAHYLSVLVPLLGLAFVVPRENAVNGGTRRPLRPAAWLALGGLAILMVLLLWGGSDQAVRFIRDNVVSRLSGERNVFLGERVAAFSFVWLEWLLGFVSQQHVAPLAQEIARVNDAAGAGIAAVAAMALAAAVLAAWKVGDARVRGAEFPREVAILAVLAGTAALHIYFAQAYVYTQAKGAQNVLPVLYACFAAVAVMALAARDGPRAIKAVAAFAFIGIAAFAATLAVPRAAFGWKLALGLDRSTILEPSFFEEAARVKGADSRSFTLFEPRKSADLYVSVEPFFGARVVPTRHLALQRMVFDRSPPHAQRLDASFFIDDADISHLWFLAPQRREGGDVWQALRIAAGGIPALYLCADDYGQDLAQRPRPGAGDRGRFSWLRNGSALVFLPAGRAYRIEATAVPADAAQLAAMRSQVAARVAAGELPGARSEERAGAVVLAFDLPPSDQPRLQRVALYGGEYWLNLRVDGRELEKSAFGAAAAVRLAAAALPARGGERSVRVSWSIEDADPQDWIGIFPEGGDDASRLAFKFTGGRKSGELELALPAAARGAFEARFFRAGSWHAVEAARIVLDAPGS